MFLKLNRSGLRGWWGLADVNFSAQMVDTWKEEGQINVD